MIKKISDLEKDNEVTEKEYSEIQKKVENLDISMEKIIMGIADNVNKISERQLDFEKKTTDAYNKLVDRFSAEMSKVNPVQNNFPAQQQQQSSEYVDKDGISWGNSQRHDEFSNSKPMNRDQNLLSKIGLTPDSAAAIVNKIIDSIQNRNTGNMGAIMNEFMVRNFFEQYQKNQLYEKAALKMMMNKGFLSEDDLKPVLENSDTLNDPINQRIKAMKTGTVKK